MSKVRRKVKVSLVEKRGQCDPHAMGDSFEYPVLFHSQVRPKGMCPALANSLKPYVQSCYLGAKSWERDDPDIWLISCPSKKGTVWKIEAMEMSDGDFKTAVKDVYAQFGRGEL